MPGQAYIALIEDEGPDYAIGILFPDIPACVSAGDTLDEAIHNAPVALQAYAEVLAEDGLALPPARTLEALKADPEIGPELSRYLLLVVPAPRVTLATPAAAE